MDKSNRHNGYFPGTFFRRSNRLTIIDKGIYYKIREGCTIGPFKTLREAEAHLTAFIRSLKSPPPTV